MSPERASALWCELAWLGGERAVAGVLVEMEGDRIGEVAVGVSEPPPRATTLPGLTIPGMTNAHSHAFQRALRGRTQAERGDFWTWRRRMYEVAESVEPDSYFALARATFAEMALAGVTTVGEFHYLHHGRGGTRYEDANAMGSALMDAAREAGIRITLLDTCYLQGGIGREAEGVQLRFSDGTADAWAERVGGLEESAMARAGAAIHSVRAVDPKSAAVVAAFAGERSRPLHAHVSEQPAENDDCLAAYGKTPTTMLADAGALSERFTAVHATHLQENDFAALSGSRCGISWTACEWRERSPAARRPTMPEPGRPLRRRWIGPSPGYAGPTDNKKRRTVLARRFTPFRIPSEFSRPGTARDSRFPAGRCTRMARPGRSSLRYRIDRDRRLATATHAAVRCRR